MKLRHRLCASLLLAMFCSVAYATDDYAKLKARLLAGDFSLDFRELRLAYAKTNEYHPNATSALESRRRMQAALQAKKYAEARTQGEAWLEGDYLNPFAHMGMARAYEKLGEVERARFHNRVLEGLYNSICLIGQGRSSDAPCKVLSIDEEHFYLGRNRLEVGSQYGVECAGKIPCDVYEVRPPGSSELSDIHFDISLPYAYAQQHPSAPATAPTTP